jgi:hypothetical protein
MRTIGPLLAVASLLLSPAWAMPQQAAPDRIGPVVGRLAKMKPAEQKAWLGRLEAREARAVKIATTYDAPPLPPGVESRAPLPAKLTPEEAAKEIAAVRGLIHRKLVTWQSLREAIEKTDAREQDAIMRLRHRYQERVFDTFYTHIDEYGRRQDAWQAVKKSWLALGAPFEPQDQMLDWLEAGILSADPKKIGPVPEMPDFSESAAATKPPVEKKPEEPKPPKKLEEPVKPPVEKKKEEPKPPKKPEEAAKPPAEKKAEEPAKSPTEKKPEQPPKPPAEKNAPPAEKKSGAPASRPEG